MKRGGNGNCLGTGHPLASTVISCSYELLNIKPLSCCIAVVMSLHIFDILAFTY